MRGMSRGTSAPSTVIDPRKRPQQSEHEPHGRRLARSRSGPRKPLQRPSRDAERELAQLEASRLVMEIADIDGVAHETFTSNSCAMALQQLLRGESETTGLGASWRTSPAAWRVRSLAPPFGHHFTDELPAPWRISTKPSARDAIG